MTEAEEHIKIITVKQLHCLRCGYDWIPKKQDEMPRTCAGCGSPYWDKARRQKK